MKMVDDRKDDQALDAFFAAATSKSPEMSEDFMARLVADAEASLPSVERPIAPATPWFGNLKTWFAASGLSGAAMVGLWIGFVMPDVVSTMTFADDTVELYTFLPGADLTAPELGE